MACAGRVRADGDGSFMGAMSVHGGGAAAKAHGASAGAAGKGKGGFSTPPGLAGRAWSELPPGIRSKVAKPEPAKPSAPTQATDGASETAAKSGTSATQPQAAIAPKVATDRPDVKLDSASEGGGLTDAELAAREASYEQYLADLSAGRTTKASEPEGFRDWARQQLLLETGRDETMQTAESALADALTAPEAPTEPEAPKEPELPQAPVAPATTGPVASDEPYNIARSPY